MKTNIQFAITNQTSENVSKSIRQLPRNVLENWFPRCSNKIEVITTLREVWSFPPSSLMGKFSVNAISADFRAMRLKIRRRPSPVCEEFPQQVIVIVLVLCAKAWSVILVNLPNNFIRITLHRRCLHTYIHTYIHVYISNIFDGRPSLTRC